MYYPIYCYNIFIYEKLCIKLQKLFIGEVTSLNKYFENLI